MSSLTSLQAAAFAKKVERAPKTGDVSLDAAVQDLQKHCDRIFEAACITRARVDAGIVEKDAGEEELNNLQAVHGALKSVLERVGEDVRSSPQNSSHNTMSVQTIREVIAMAEGFGFSAPDTPQWGDPKYWQDHYRSRSSSNTLAGSLSVGFEWQASSYKEFQEHFRSLGLQSLSPILHVGCGISRLPLEMLEDGFVGPIVNTDISPELVKALKKHHGERDDLVWEISDVTNMKYGDGKFAAVVDKSTMDGMWCAGGEGGREQVSSALLEMRRVTKPHGLIVICSNHHPEENSWPKEVLRTLDLDVTEVMPPVETGSGRGCMWIYALRANAKTSGSIGKIPLDAITLNETEAGSVEVAIQLPECQICMEELALEMCENRLQLRFPPTYEIREALFPCKVVVDKAQAQFKKKRNLLLVVAPRAE
eukprot:gnl/MRDRNA2_/MRDRNA2_85566_c0_seq1.p1 gnl/MRDRNA2_/MRDRNA2_85566_c0~~gnl/MRDRNA2_/MRDRNA2_85566_c0_seq1.p1  ORF type:complete len:423 (+),score=97.82 gnl/MRDRNA2_/MRDRNA2_85566_c0_seq1:115-1383(+)